MAVRWATVLAMSIKLWFTGSGMILMLIAAPGLRADVLEMQNGDRYSGKVSVGFPGHGDIEQRGAGQNHRAAQPSREPVIGHQCRRAKSGRQSSRNHLHQSSPGNRPGGPGNTNMDLSAALRQLGANTNFVGQIRQQMLAGNPEAARKYDELVSGLLSGQLNVSDVRQQAQTAAAQLRELKQQLGPEADDSLDGYLQVLDSFIKETADEPADAAPKSP